MRRVLGWSFPLFLVLALAMGCGNPMKRPPVNVFPGSEDYAKRVESFKITPSQAYNIAYEKAKADNQVHYVSRKPTVIAKRWYVFSLPMASGANLQGYHVNGDNGEVKFMSEKKTVPHAK